MFRVTLLYLLSHVNINFLHTSSPKESESGVYLALPLDSSLSVTFHAIVPLSAWNWNDNSLMTIRFGDPKLSGWNKDGGALLMKQ